jgi:DNA-binding winged helix-turn-helix (wHTH) protein
MIFEFGQFTLDGWRRELRLAGREVALQPIVFDVLAYLIRHRDRVVTKSELLEAIWPDAVVSEGSLKRAVSLARSALRGGAAQDAIRNYARQGYRFCLEDVREERIRTSEELPEPLARARRALEEQRWSGAARAFREADAQSGLAAADLERWAQAAQHAGEAQEAVPPLERAVAGYAAAGDRAGAARAALGLAQIHYERLQLSVGRGWLRRVASSLAATELSREHGMLAWLESRYALADGNLEETLCKAERAREIGRAIDDVDLDLLGMSIQGHALLAQGQVEPAVALHDEAAATVLSVGASPWVGGLVYCGVIWACRNRGDWRRAAEWTETYDRWCKRSSLEAFPGTCRLHRAEVMLQRGELDDAEREITEAAATLARVAPWAEGDAQRVLGDVRLARGEHDRAAEAYRQAHELGYDPQPGLARLQLTRGEARSALRGLERSLADQGWSSLQRRGVLLATMVSAALAAGEQDAARKALAELEAHPEHVSSPVLAAQLDVARSEIMAHEGDLAEAITFLRRAVRGLQREETSLEVPRHRLRLAQLFLDAGDTAAARLELGGVRRLLEQQRIEGLVEEVDRLAALCQTTSTDAS